MASDILRTDAWTRARDRYLEDLTVEEKNMFLNASLENIFYDASAAQKLHQANSRTRQLGTKLQPFIATIEQYSMALDVYSNASSAIISPIWGSVKVLLHLASEFGKYFDRLVEMFASIGDVLPRFRVYEKLFPSHERLVQALSVAYLDILNFCIDAKAIFRKAKRSSVINMKISFKLLWKPFNEQFGRLIDDFREHRKNVEKEAGLSHMIEAQDARAMQQFNQMQMEKEKKENDRIHLLSMLSSIRHEIVHRKLQRVRHPKTGAWFAETGQFKDWKSKKCSSCLCCYGIPGSGKTVLASNIIDILSSEINNQEFALAYYYCDYSNQEALKTSNILGSLVQQLLFRTVTIPEAVETQIRQSYANGMRTPDRDELIEILSTVMELHSLTYVVIDGLDECGKEAQEDILFAVKRLATFKKSVVKVLVSSREEAQISASLKGYQRIQMSEGVLEGDIVTFVEDTVNLKLESGELAIRNSALRQEIIAELVNKAQGMFLWVSFQLEEICDATQSDDSIRATLRNLPEGLIDTYVRILTKIEKKSSRVITVAQKIFKWVVCARRPLLIDELKEAIAFELVDQSWSSDKIPADFDGKRLVQACGNLVVLDSEGTVRLAHHTVQQFLLSEGRYDATRRFQFQYSEASLYAGEICVTYLSFSDFETQVTVTTPERKLACTGILETAGLNQIPQVAGINKKILNLSHLVSGGSTKTLPDIDYTRFFKLNSRNPPPVAMEQKYKLLNYVIENWAWHTLDFSETNARMWQMFRHLALEKAMAFDFRIWGSNRGPQDLPYMTLFHWAVEAGHTPFLRLLLAPPAGSSLLAYCKREQRLNQTPMLIASRLGHENVLELLMEIDNSYLFDARLLTESAVNGHAAVVGLLLEKGADIEARDGSGGSALRRAVENEHEAVVRMLLEKGANIEAKDVSGRTVLHQVAENGHEAVMELLLEKGADVKLKDDSGKTALHLAIENGHVALAWQLLEREDWHNGKEVIQQLLSQYQEIHVTKEVIRAVAGRFDEELMQLLFSREQEIQITEDVIKAAARNPWNGKKMVQLLLALAKETQITAEILEAAAGNYGSGGEVMQLLLSQDGKAPITEEVIKAAAGNYASGGEVMQLLLSQDGKAPITEEVIKVAAGNLGNGKEVIQLLLTRDRDILVTYGVLKVAAQNYFLGKETLQLLLNHYEDNYVAKTIYKMAAECHMGIMERTRQSAIREIVSTERDFVKDLEFIRDYWIQPLLSTDPTNPSPIPEHCREGFVQSVFSSVLDVHAVNSCMSEALDRRQLDNIVRNVGDIFLEFVPHFGPFIKYDSNRLYGEYELEKEKASNPAFFNFIEYTGRPKLNDYLAKPMERLAMYPPLLQRVQHYTGYNNPDVVDIPKALDLIHKFLARLSVESKIAENRFNLLKLQQDLVFPFGEYVDLKLMEEGRQLDLMGFFKIPDSRDNIQVFLLDHAVVFVQVDKSGKLEVYRRPIPLELLSISIPTSSSSIPSPKWVPAKTSFRDSLRAPALSSYTLTFRHFGKRGYQLTLQLPSLTKKLEWIEHIEARHTALRKRSSVFNKVVLGKDFFNVGNAVECLAPIGDGRQLVYGTKTGIYVSDKSLNNSSVKPERILEIEKVTQIEFFQEHQILLVLQNENLISYLVEALDPTLNQSVLLKSAKKITAHTSFFKSGVCLGKHLICAIRPSTLSTIINVFQLMEGDQKMQHFKVFYVPTSGFSVHFLKTNLCIGCASGFEIVDLETLQTQSLLDAKDTSFDFVRRPEYVGDDKPIHFAHLGGNFLLSYSGFSFFINRNGRRARPDWKITWEGRPTAFALSHPYILAFEPRFIEIRNLETSELVQILTGWNIRMLHSSAKEIFYAYENESGENIIASLNF